MAKQIINIGQSANDRSGDPLRTAFAKVNGMFDEVYSVLESGNLQELAQDYAAEMFTNGTHDGITVEYDDAGNVINLTVVGKTVSGPTPPVNPILGELWYDTAGGRLYVYYDSSWIDASPENFYTLPTASGSILGGIKVGANLSIDGNGVLSAGNSYVLPTATTSVLGGVKVDGTTVTIDGNGVISAPDPNLLGDLIIDGQTISGTVSNADIILNPNGTGLVDVPGLKIPVGSLIQGAGAIDIIVAPLILEELVDWSVADEALPAGTYGNPEGIPAPWTVYKFTTNPAPVLQINDWLAGVGIPIDPLSTVRFVGAGAYVRYVVIDNYSFENTNPLLLPQPGQSVFITRPIVNAGLTISTSPETDITLNPGGGGFIVPHSSIIPFTHNVLSIGTPTKRFKDIWLGAGTLYVLDETLGSDLAIGARDGLLYIAGGAGLTVGEFTFQDNQMLLGNPSREIIIGSTDATGPVTFNRPIKVISGVTGNDTFDVSRDGLVTIKTPQTILTTQSALEIIGSSTGNSRPRNFNGTLLQLTAQDGQPARVSLDAFGANTYAIVAGRQARGTVDLPTATQSGDTLMRFSTQGYGTTNYVSSIGRINFQATQNFTDSAGGTRIRFQTTPTDSIIIQTVSADIDPTGLSFVGNATGGITFSDSSRQTTAWTGTVAAEDVTGLSLVATTNNYSDLTGLPTLFSGDYDDLTDKPNVVTSIGVTSGLTVGRVNGEVTLGNSGVLSVAAAAGTGQLTVGTVGGAVTLTMPQGLGTTSNVTFNDLTINGTLTVSDINIETAPTIAGKILYLAADAVNNNGINGGGIILGPIDDINVNYRSFLYNLEFDRWDTNGAGLKTQGLFSDTIGVQGRAYFGNAYIDYDFPNAVIQIDGNVNSYVQIVTKNHSDGIIASADVVATNDIGDDTAHYIDMGIVSSNYTDELWPILAANDGYVYINSGNLRIGTDTATKNIKFFTGGTLEENIRATISDTGLTVVGTTSSTLFSGPLTGNVTGNVSGNAGTVTNGVYTTDTGTVTNTMLAGSIANNKLTNSSVTVNGTTISLGGSGTVTAAASTLTGTTLASGITTSSLTSVGTLTNLTVTNPISGSVTGNAGTVTNGVYTTGSYNNPTWIIGLAYSKLTGAPTALSAFSNDTNFITSAALTGYATQTYVNSQGFITTGSLSVTSNTPSGTTSTLTYNNGVFTFTSAAASSYTLPTASTTVLGGVKIDGTTISINGSGVISAVNNGTVTSVSGTGSVSGLTLSGTVTGTGSLTLGGTLSLTSNQVTTALGYTPYNSTNPAGYTNNTGTVTSVSGTGTVNGLTLTGSVTTSGSLTLGGTLSGIGNGQLTNSTISGVALGGSLSAVTFNNAGTGDVSGTTYNGSAVKTISYNTIGAYAATNPSGYTSNTGTVTSVAALTLGTTGTDVSSTVATGTTTPVITLNLPTASATARGALSAADWTTFNSKGNGTVTSVSGTGTVSGLTLTGTVTGTGSLTLGGTLSGIANNQLTNSTISGVALGGSLFNLTAGTGITFSSGTTYNGSAAITINATATSGVSSLAGGTNIVLSGSTGAVTIQRVDGLQSVVTGNSGATYNVLTTDQYVGTTRSLTGTGTITLPLGSTVSVGRQYIIKDEGGQSGNVFRRITVAASGSDTIDGSATRSITSNYGALTVLWTGTRWSVI